MGANCIYIIVCLISIFSTCELWFTHFQMPPFYPLQTILIQFSMTAAWPTVVTPKNLISHTGMIIFLFNKMFLLQKLILLCVIFESTYHKNTKKKYHPTIFYSQETITFLTCWYTLPDSFWCLNMYIFFYKNEIILYMLFYNMLSSVNALYLSLAIYFFLYYIQFCKQIFSNATKMSFTTGFFSRKSF